MSTRTQAATNFSQDCPREFSNALGKQTGDLSQPACTNSEIQPNLPDELIKDHPVELSLCLKNTFYTTSYTVARTTKYIYISGHFIRLKTSFILFASLGHIAFLFFKSMSGGSIDQ